jgi:hypothetical protein
VNVVEHWAEDQLTRVPTGPAPAALRRRARVRRARRVGGSFAAVALVLGGFGVGVLSRSPSTSHVDITQPVPTTTALPDASVREFPQLAKIASLVSSTVREDAVRDPDGAIRVSAEIVSTTAGHTNPVFAPSPRGSSARVYMVQVVGDLVCRSCPGFAVRRSHVAAEQFLFDASGRLDAFSDSRPVDLSRIGTAYRLLVNVTGG